MTTFDSLPLDMLLVVFRELEIIDFIRLGMTCKGFYYLAQDRQVWADQLEKLCRERPFLRPATAPLASLSAQELKTFAMGRVRLHRRFNDGNKNLGFAAQGTTEILGIHNLMLLPGGKSLLAINNSASEGNTTLRRIRLEGGRASLPVAASIKLGERMTFGFLWRKLLITTSPCPVLVHFQSDMKSSTIWIVKIDHHKGAMNLETTIRLPRRSSHPAVDGQGRVIGLVVQQPGRVVVIHLDHPGVTIEADIPPTYAATASREPDSWGICMPTENLVIVHNTENIFMCKIPNFLGLSPGTHSTSMTPMWSWPGLDRSERGTQCMVPCSEAVHDPHSAREFDLYYVAGYISKVITITVAISTCNNDDDDHTLEPGGLGGLQMVKQESTVIEDCSEGLGANDCSTKGLHVRRLIRGNEVTYVVVPLKNLPSRSPGHALWLSVSREGFKHDPQMDIDEATGRVVCWGRDTVGRGIKVFVGNLV